MNKCVFHTDLSNNVHIENVSAKDKENEWLANPYK
jgi:hypothetical protein